MDVSGSSVSIDRSPDAHRFRLEHIAKAKKKKVALTGSTKETAKSLGAHQSEESDGDEDAEDSGEDTSWKREILFGRKKEKERRGKGETSECKKGGEDGEDGFAAEGSTGNAGSQTVPSVEDAGDVSSDPQTTPHNTAVVTPLLSAGPAPT